MSSTKAEYVHVAQLVEQRPFKAWAGGSIPSMGTNIQSKLTIFAAKMKV